MLVAFDLDGTLCDPLLGISRSINYALEHVHASPKDNESLRQYIGPPLEQVFSQLLTDDSLVEPAMAAFRERYKSTGFKECSLYPGTELMLSTLKDHQCQLRVVTSKAQQVAEQMLEHFSLADYFSGVWGSEKGRSKSESLLLAKAKTADKTFMVGDRKYDIQAAIACDTMHAAVLWGFGSKAELVQAGATCLVNDQSQLTQLLLSE